MLVEATVRRVSTAKRNFPKDNSTRKRAMDGCVVFHIGLSSHYRVICFSAGYTCTCSPRRRHRQASRRHTTCDSVVRMSFSVAFQLSRHLLYRSSVFDGTFDREPRQSIQVYAYTARPRADMQATLVYDNTVTGGLLRNTARYTLTIYLLYCS